RCLVIGQQEQIISELSKQALGRLSGCLVERDQQPLDGLRALVRLPQGVGLFIPSIWCPSHGPRLWPKKRRPGSPDRLMFSSLRAKRSNPAGSPRRFAPRDDD